MQTPKSIVLEELSNVPPFPPVAVRLLALLASPTVEVKEVAELIASDATFTARLLQCVNSYEFGLTSPVSNIQQAVGLVGLDRTRQVILAHATAAYAKGAFRAAELRRCWQHTVATAVLSDEIAQCCEAFTDVAFTAGIMHDIGRLGLLLAHPREYERIIRTAAERCLDLLDFERDEFGMDHAEAGRILAERWGLPLELGIVAGRHHDACEGAELDLIRIVHVACRLADVLGYDVTHPLVQLDVETVLSELPARARARMKRTPAELCTRIEKRILEYDADTPEQLAEPALAEEEATPPEATVEPKPDLTGKPASSAVGLIVTVALCVLVVLAVFLLWKSR